MLISRKRHKVPELNMVATADISFMLLIFFLVTTSMDTDRGLQRKLPPMDNNDKQVEQFVEQGNTLTLSLTDDSRLLVEGEEMPAENISKTLSRFISKKGDDHLIILEVNPKSDYGLYFRVQNKIVEAYADVREQISMTLFQKHYRLLDEEDAAEVLSRCPHNVTER